MARVRPKVVEIFETGGMFGEIGVFTGHRYRTWTQAVGTALLIHVPRERILEAVALDAALSNRHAGGGLRADPASYRCDQLHCCRNRFGAGCELPARSVRPAERPEAGVILPAPKKTIARSSISRPRPSRGSRQPGRGRASA